MQSRTLSAAIVVALVAAAVILFVVLNGDDGDDGGSVSTNTPATPKQKPQRNKRAQPKVPTIVLEGGEPVGGVAELEYSAGDLIRFDVESDIAEEVHVHGYDLMKDVEPGKVVRFSFPAEIEGGFEVELEESHTQIAELTVEPG